MPRRKAATVAKRKAIAALIDTNWFYQRMSDAGQSLRGTAAALGLDVAVLHRRLHGVSPMELGEALHLAHILDVPFGDLVRRCGLIHPAEPDSMIPIVGLADAQGAVTFPKRVPGPAKTRRPSEAPAKTVAVRVDAPGSPLDQWLCFYVPTTRIEAEAVGRLNVVTTLDGRHWLAVLRQGYQRGRWNLKPLYEGTEHQDTAVASAAPVLMVRT